MRIVIPSFVVASMFTGGFALAASYDVGPANLTSDLSSGFGWDTDKPAPIGVDTTGTVDGNSFWSDVSGSDPRKYSAFRFTPAAIGLSGLTIADITSLSYDTKKDGGTIDWRFNIYTAKASPSDSGWYGYRLSFNPGNVSNHDWATFDLNNLTVSSLRNGATGVENFSTTFGGAQTTTGALPIMFIDIIAGANSPTYVVDAYLDNIQIGTSTGSGSINLIPEPTTLGALALGGVALLRRRRA